MARAILVLVALVALMATPALAEDRSEWCRMHNVGCQDDATRVYAWRKWEKPRPDYRIEIRRRAAIERDRERRLERERDRREERRELIREGRLDVRDCIAPRRAIGEEHVKRETAEAAADRAWEAAVSYDHGRRYMDLGNARRVTHTCSRSRPSKESAIGQAADAAGLFYTVCVTEAVPCRPIAIEDDGK